LPACHSTKEPAPVQSTPSTPQDQAASASPFTDADPQPTQTPTEEPSLPSPTPDTTAAFPAESSDGAAGLPAQEPATKPEAPPSDNALNSIGRVLHGAFVDDADDDEGSSGDSIFGAVGRALSKGLKEAASRDSGDSAAPGGVAP